MAHEPEYQTLVTAGIMVAMSLLLSACATVTPAPGADEIRLTATASEVTPCKPVGNIETPRAPNGLVDIGLAKTQFRNLAVGLGSNAALVTEGSVNHPVAGIAYRCP